MSASREKYRRQNADKESVSKKQQAIFEQQKQKKKTSAIAIAVCAVIVVLAVLVAVVCSDFMRRNAVAAVIDGEKITVDVFEYYYRNTFSQMYNQVYSAYGQYASYFMPQNIAYCRTTEYSENQTWYEYLLDETAATISSVRNYCRLAEEEGFTLDKDDLFTIEDTKQSIKEEAEKQGMSIDEFLAASYGKGMTFEVYCRELENTVLANSYLNHIAESFEYTAEEKENYYGEKVNDLDVYTVRAVNFTADQIEGYDETKPEETVEKIRGWYSEIESAVKSGKNFYEAVAPYSDAGTAEEDGALITENGTRLNSFYYDWVVDTARTEGDMTFAETENGGYVVQFVSREDNAYSTRDFRAMLYPISLSRSNFNSEEEYQSAYATYEQFAENATSTYYTMWQENGSSVEAFEKAAEAYAADTGYVQQLYEKTMKGDFGALSEWLYDDGRQVGDVERIYSEELGAYCVVCYVGENDTARDVIADEGLRDADYEAWYETTENARAENFSCVYKFWRRLVGE